MSADHREFFEQVIPEPHVILGMQLRPFSLGHLILLTRIESAFITGGETTLTELIAAIFVCSLSWQDNLRVLHTGKVDRQWGPFKWRGSQARFLRRWQKKIGLFDLLEKSEAFRRYMDSASKMPTFSYKLGESREVKCPSAQIVFTYLLSHLNLRESEILNRPWGRCLWDFMTLKDSAGHLRLEDVEDLSATQRAADEFHNRITGNGGA